jgi:hypothetical protein
MSHPAVRFEVKLALYVAVIAVVSMWIYQGSTRNEFVWDSTQYLIIYVDHISSLSLENLKWMATSLEFHNWHPLTWLSWAIDYQIYDGLVPWGFHFSNNLLHAINSVVLFIFILMVFGLVAPGSGKFVLKQDNPSLIAALLAALLFAVHPQHVESVAWVAERKDLLCQLFLLLSLITYIKYVTCQQTSRTKWYVITLILYFLAVMSKPMAVTFPVVLLLVDVYPLRRTALFNPVIGSIRQQSWFSLAIEKIPFFLLSFILILTTLLAQKTAIVDVSLAERVVNAVHSTILYLEKFMMPFALNPHYPYFEIAKAGSLLKGTIVFFAFAAITIATVLAWRKQRPAWAIAWLLYLVTLSPVLGLIQVGAQGAADRYSYFPTLPLYLLVAGGIFSILKNGKSYQQGLLLLFTTGLIMVFGFQAMQQIMVWKSEISLWTHVAKLSPEKLFAHNNLGIAYKNIGDYENALIQFNAGGEENSGPNSIYAWRGITYMHLARFQESIGDLVKLGAAAESRPELVVDTSCIQYNIGWNFAQLGMYPEAIELFSRVDVSSGSGSNAIAWLSELNANKPQTDAVNVSQDLPGICENLIPSRARSQRK